jgi:DNA-binding NarL/FixJ family response regulator
MARIIAAHVELRCGRKFAGQRHLAASSLRDVPETDLAVLVASGSLSEEAAPKWLAGYVRAMRQADTAAARRATVLELTTTEQTVLALLAEGQPAKLVASSLGIRTSTVRTHAAAIAKNLGTHTIVETIAEARRRGIL